MLEESPESAAAVMQKLKSRFAGAIPAQLGDEAIQVTDRYLGRVTGRFDPSDQIDSIEPWHVHVRNY